MAELEGKVAIVTGAGSGIGRATALAYAKAGALVLVSDINEPGAHETVRLIAAQGGTAHAIRTDVSRASECDAMVAHALERFGRLDVACNNAGIGGEQAPTGELSIDGWDHVLATNLSSTFYCMKHEIAAMLRGGGGAIINMASILGTVGFAGAAAYVTSKHGMIGLTRTAALEYATQNIRGQRGRPGVHPHAAHRRARRGGAAAPSGRATRRAGGGGGPRPVSQLRSCVVHHGQLLPDRWGIPGALMRVRTRRRPRFHDAPAESAASPAPIHVPATSRSGRPRPRRSSNRPAPSDSRCGRSAA